MNGFYSATFRIGEYSAVIPMIQNVYSPEETASGFQVGFKYTSGVFEYFHFGDRESAEHEYDRLLRAIDSYYLLIARAASGWRGSK